MGPDSSVDGRPAHRRPPRSPTTDTRPTTDPRAIASPPNGVAGPFPPETEGAARPPGPATTAGTGTGAPPPAGEGRPDRAERTKAWLAVLLAVLAAGLLRGPLTVAGLPGLHQPDEAHNILVGERMVAGRTADPGSFVYPALVYDVEATVLAPFVDGDEGWRSHADDTLIVRQTFGNAQALRPGLVATLRWVVGVLPALVTVATAGALAWLASRRWWASGLAAGLAALSPLELRFGPLITPDALAGATTGLAVLGAVWVLARPRAARYLMAGAAVGVAAAAKYNAALSGIALATAHVLTLDLRRPWQRWWLPVLALAAAAAAFVVFNPFALLDADGFAHGLRYNSRHYRTGHPGSEGGALAFHLSSLWRAFGPALVLVPLALLARDRRQRQAAAVVVSFVVAYAAVISSFEVRFARNLLPLTAPLAAAAALGAVAVVQRIADWTARPGVADGTGPTERPDGRDRAAGADPGRRRRLTGAVAALVGAAAVLAWPAVEARAAFTSTTADPSAEAQEWIDVNVPAGSRVAVAPYGAYVDPDRYRVLELGALTAHDIDWYRERDVAVIVGSERHFHRYLEDPERYQAEAAAFTRFLDETCPLLAAGPEGGQVLVLDPHPC